MAEKHIFIGLGGAGVNTVTKVKYKIYEKLTETKHKTRLDLLNDKYRFLFVDTDAKDINDNNEEYRNRYENGKIDFIDPSKELVDLGDQNPKVIYEEAREKQTTQINKRILEACDEKVAATIPNSSLRHGAGAFRIKSRIAFARKADEFNNKLRMSITDLNSISGGATERNTIYYWVVASSNGGTGSGILNDVLYYVNMMHKQLIDKEDPMVGLLLYMPQYYIDVNSTNERYPKNAYAVLSELEAFQCLSKLGDVPVSYHRLALNRDYHQFDTKTSYRPFSYCIPVDYQTDKNTNLGSIMNMYYNTAEMLYYIHSGSGAQGFRSILDNYINEIQGRVAEAFLIPMGYIALRKPEKDFEDYIQLRMRYELLKYGIIGEQLQSETERKVVRDALYNNVVKKNLFDSGAGSLQGIFRNMVNAKVEEDLPDNLILDSNNKISKELPANISNTEAERIILDMEVAINRKQDVKEKFLLDIEAELWKWVEQNTIKYGLEYVNAALYELDGYCTDLYNEFTLDQGGKTAKRKVLQKQADDIAQELEGLYQAAVTITLSERISGKNSEDVNRYFQRLKEYVRHKTDLIADEQTYDILRLLSVGDNGIIDKMKRFTANLLSEAHALLSGEKGAQFAYEELSKSFLGKKQDVTSVYLPEIQEFAEGYGWKDNHEFSGWYAQIIHHTDHYDRGKGFTPLRSGGVNSLEGFLRNMIGDNLQALTEKGYLLGEDSRLFSNQKAGNPKKILEDILNFAYDSMKFRCRNNSVINSEWFLKTLPEFYDELDLQKRKEIKQRLDPCLFFSYNKARDNNLLAIWNIYVSNNVEVAKEILSYNSNDNTSKFSPAEDPSMVYTIRAKMGMSFDFYRTFDIIKREYDRTSAKAEFHFHKAFANSNGDYKHILLPKELEPELHTFVQYLLMDGFKDVLADYYHASSNSFDKDNYTNTPFVMEATRALIATRRNLQQRGEYVCLTIKEGENDCFESLLFGNAENPYSIMYEKFKSMYVRESLETTIEELISTMVWKARRKMEENYDLVRESLIRKLDKSINDIKSKEEKRLVSEILEALTRDLNVLEKFLN